MHRPTIGVLAIVLMVVATGLYLWDFQARQDYLMVMSGCLRVGLVLAALWLAIFNWDGSPAGCFAWGRPGDLCRDVAAPFLFIPLLLLIWLMKPRGSRGEARIF